MSANPVANPGQFAAEAEVRAMWEQTQTRAAKAHCAQLWRIAHGPEVPPGIDHLFDPAMDAWISNYLFKAAARDPAAPRFVRDFMPAYSWRGESVPDARMGGDNPDNTYRLAGIRHGHAYRVSGQVLPACPAQVSFTLVENWGTSITCQTIELPGITVEEDGSFVITIDDQPANGRPNHMTTNERVKFLFVRDSMMDWAAETPLRLEIERVDAKPCAALSFEQRLDEALRRVREEVPLYYWFVRLSSARAPNTMPQPMRTASVGGLVTQATSLGRFHLEDNEAAVVRFHQAGARYNSFQMAMWWYQSIDAHQRQSGLTYAQCVPDADGWATVVVGARDPGHANWVDTGGLKDLFPMIRWQGMPEGADPGHTLEIVPFDRLDQVLGPDAPRLDAAGRAGQLAARRAAWERRITP